MNIIKELNGGHEYVVTLWKHSPHLVSISDAVLQMSRATEAQRKVGGVDTEWVWSWGVAVVS